LTVDNSLTSPWAACTCSAKSAASWALNVGSKSNSPSCTVLVGASTTVVGVVSWAASNSLWAIVNGSWVWASAKDLSSNSPNGRVTFVASSISSWVVLASYVSTGISEGAAAKAVSAVDVVIGAGATLANCPVSWGI